MTFWIIYILVQISILGTALGRFSQFFKNFCRRATMVADIFSQLWGLTLVAYKYNKCIAKLRKTPEEESKKRACIFT